MDPTGLQNYVSESWGTQKRTQKTFKPTLFVPFRRTQKYVVYYESIKREPKIRGIYELCSAMKQEPSFFLKKGEKNEN
jgi:hypothetical protein